MRPLRIVVDQILVEVRLHFGDRLVELLPPLDAEVLVQQGSVEAFDEAVALGSADLRGPVLDALEL